MTLRSPEFFKRLVADAVGDAVEHGLVAPLTVLVASGSEQFLVAHYDESLAARILASHPPETGEWRLPVVVLGWDTTKATFRAVYDVGDDGEPEAVGASGALMN